MASPTQTLSEKSAGILTKLALELNFVEPGKDAGLLPINSFVAEIEDILRAQSAPEDITQAVGHARQAMDKLFDTTVAFDAPAIALLGDWQAWMATAVANWQNGKPVPALPAAWKTTSMPAAAPTAALAPVDSHSAPGVAVVNATEPALTLSLDSDGELLREFINESQEHLQNIENGVLVLEDNPKDADTLNSIFRAFHTFKGGSGFLNLTPIKNLAHELESLLDAARQHKLTIDSPIIDLILQGGDTLKAFVAQIGAQLNGTGVGEPILVPTLTLIARVKAVLGHPGAAAAPAAAVAKTSEVAPAAKPAPASAALPRLRQLAGRRRFFRGDRGCN